MDYEALGLKAGIEIHQQLDTEEKLFCRCPTLLRETDEHTGSFFRYLRATESELGEIDRAAQEEMKLARLFCYLTYDTTCLVEYDEEPPAPLNREALAVCLTIAKMFGMTPIEQVHTMRKLVIDGSNTSGFQRTACVAVNGILPDNCGSRRSAWRRRPHSVSKAIRSPSTGSAFLSSRSRPPRACTPLRTSRRSQSISAWCCGRRAG